MTATMDFPTTAAPTIPAPRTEHDPHAWLRGLSRPEISLALALSDMPTKRSDRDQALGGYLPAVHTSTRLFPRRLTSSGVRVLTSWVVQGVERAGGLASLWESANEWTSINCSGRWDTPAGKAFFRRFGGQRRIESTLCLADDLPIDLKRVRVSIRLTEHTDALIQRLSRRYEVASQTGPVVVFLMTPHAAQMVATVAGLSLAPGYREGFRLV